MNKLATRKRTRVPSMLVEGISMRPANRKRRVAGRPVEADISTLHVDWQNFNMRMGIRRFTPLTDASGKEIANYMAMLALYTTHCNFVRVHKALRMAPAMAAGLSAELRDMEWIVGLPDARAPKPRRPEPYRKRISC
ncbi:MAG: hypothetical protein OXP66_07570 [Candidatus Tectomicrobia bacterium]|nr:hypothetical protein [Candidatus Tectomicrobia bacterium]